MKWLAKNKVWKSKIFKLKIIIYKCKIKYFLLWNCFIEVECSHEQTCFVCSEIIISVGAYFLGKQDFVQTM